MFTRLSGIVTGLVLLLCLFLSCGEDKIMTSEDTIPPAQITDLWANCQSDKNVTLYWTAPGDDSLSGTADRYEIGISSVPITDENWNNVTLTSNPPAPNKAGFIDSFTVTGLLTSHYYYFGIKTDIRYWTKNKELLESKIKPKLSTLPTRDL